MSIAYRTFLGYFYLLIAFSFLIWRWHKRPSVFPVIRTSSVVAGNFSRTLIGNLRNLSTGIHKLDHNIECKPFLNNAVFTMGIGNMGHDASIALAINGEVFLVVELERITGVPRFGCLNTEKGSSHAVFWIWSFVYKSFAQACLHLLRCKGNIDPVNFFENRSFTFGTFRQTTQIARKRVKGFSSCNQAALSSMFNPPQRKGLVVTRPLHHDAHAAYGFWDSPFHSALIISADGGGGDASGAFNIYIGSSSVNGTEIRLLHRFDDDLSIMYGVIAAELRKRLGWIGNNTWTSCKRLMDLSTHAEPTPELVKSMRVIEQAKRNLGHTPRYLGMYIQFSQNTGKMAEEIATAKVLAASAHEFLRQNLFRSIDGVKNKWENYKIDGIVFVGGIAFNTLINTALVRYYQLPVHIPADPGDGGCAMGLLWHALSASNSSNSSYFTNYSISKVKKLKEHLALGLPLEGVEYLPSFASKCHGESIQPNRKKGLDDDKDKGDDKNERFDFDRLAHLLCVAGQVVGIVRGRQHIGGTAMVGRNILFAPTLTSDRLATIRNLSSMLPFEPFTIVMMEEMMVEILDDEIGSNGQKIPISYFYSPYGMLAPRLKRNISLHYPDVADGKGQGRVQTVRSSAQPWLHHLLRTCKDRFNLPFLIFQPLCIHKQPSPLLDSTVLHPNLISSVEEALIRLVSNYSIILDSIVIENYLFIRQEVVASSCVFS